jgi:ribose/xylose/arabinose/galactoside ABC-type transport system permease subunit
VFLGVVLLTVLTTGLDIGGINQFVQQMVTGLVLIGAVLIARTRGAKAGALSKLFRRQKYTNADSGMSAGDERPGAARA